MSNINIVGPALANACQDFFCVPAEQIIGDSRAKIHVVPRHILIYVLLQHYTQADVANWLMKDHATILHAQRAVRHKLIHHKLGTMKGEFIVEVRAIEEACTRILEQSFDGKKPYSEHEIIRSLNSLHAKLDEIKKELGEIRRMRTKREVFG